MLTLGGRVHHVYSVRLTREAARISVLGAGLFLTSLASAAAQDPHAEIFPGLEASNNAITGYLGAGYAFGKGLYEPGWRVRAAVRRWCRSRHDLRRRCELWRGTSRLSVPRPSPDREAVRRGRGRGSEDQSARSGQFGVRQRRRPQARSRKLARPFAVMVLVHRRVVRNRVSAILELGAGRLSPRASLLPRHRRWRARQ